MIYTFGEFTLDTATGVVRGPDGEVSLRRQTFRLLEVLLEHAPELVDRDTLLDQAWGRTALSPNVLPQSISELRHALGDSPQAPRYIATVHRRGYRVVTQVDRVDADRLGASAPAPGARSAASSRVQRLGLAFALTALVALTGIWWQQQSERRWLVDELLPQARELARSDVVEAWRLVRDARGRIQDDPSLEQLWLDLTLPVSIASEPEGAEIAVTDYGATWSDPIVLGRTPLVETRLPLGLMRFRARHPGYVPVESAPNYLPWPNEFRLHRAEDTPEGMVYVPEGPARYPGGDPVVLPGFWIGAHEVTNREFLRFVDDGGYERPELWPAAVVSEGQTIDPPALMERLVDQTGFPGPSTWSLGTFPEDKPDHPVEGVSWYEASAYATWAGAELPSVFHWYRAAGLGSEQSALFSDIIGSSNFGGRSTTAVGSLGGIGPYGTYDMAGNVREWCRNSAGELRHSLGAAWFDNSYRFRDDNAFEPLERGEGFGFRLLRQDARTPSAVMGEVQIHDRVVSVPVDDETFEIYRRLYDYDPVALDAQIESVDDSHDAWRRERISLVAAYSDERFAVQVLLPRDAAPPYPAVVHFPGGDALLLESSLKAGLLHVEPFLRTGRAVIYPVYKGTFERRVPPVKGPLGLRDLTIQQVKDVRRTLDYLETRDDIDVDRLAFHALSYGASRSPFVLAVEPRFRAAMLVSVGLSPSERLPPEIKQVDYLPRVSLPVLMVTGKNDFTFPYATAQRPFFELLGTPDALKHHLAFDWGHLPPGYVDLTRALIDWSDRWLGN